MVKGSTTLAPERKIEKDLSAQRVVSKPKKPFLDSIAIKEVAFLLVFAVSMRLPWIFMIPISEAPDEGAHYWVINFIATNLRLPELADMAKEPGAAYYGALSAFSYIPHLICAKLMPWFNAPFAYRFGSLIMGLVSVIAARAIGHQLFPKSRMVALAVPLFLVFHPQLCFVNGYSNNDSASMAIATLCIYASLRAVQNGITSRFAIWLGVLCGFLALSKPTTYCIFPAVVAAIVMAAIFHRQALSALGKKLVVTFSIASIIALPFFLKNWFQFNCDLLGMRTMLDLWWTAYGKPQQLYHWPVINNPDWRYCAYLSYIGNLGNMNRLLPSKIYKFYSYAITLCAIGWTVVPVFLFVRNYMLQQMGFTMTSLTKTISERRIEIGCWLVIALSVLFNFATLVAGSASLNATGPPQGRYLFPCEAAIAALLVCGLTRLGGRPLVLAFLALNAVASIISLTMLYPVYHFDVNIFR